MRRAFNSSKVLEKSSTEVLKIWLKTCGKRPLKQRLKSH